MFLAIISSVVFSLAAMLHLARPYPDNPAPKAAIKMAAPFLSLR